ncbi:MAG: AzlD domain-containing protein [Firmicutes bacterium]|nr:AzlD domain-containing protein [Bacillota bacterium]
MRSEILFIIIGMAAVTYLTRFGCLVLFRYTGIPSFLHGWLKHIPTAILTALIVPSLLLPKGYLDLTIQNHYLIAGILAAVIAYKSRNIIATVGLGIMVMISLNWLDKL